MNKKINLWELAIISTLVLVVALLINYNNLVTKEYKYDIECLTNGWEIRYIQWLWHSYSYIRCSKIINK